MLTTQDVTQLDNVSLTGRQLDPPTVRDGFPGGGTDTSPMNPYVNHVRVAVYVTTEADIGQRWITMLGYCSSSYAGAGDYLLNEQMEGELSVLQMSGASTAASQPTNASVSAAPASSVSQQATVAQQAQPAPAPPPSSPTPAPSPIQPTPIAPAPSPQPPAAPNPFQWLINLVTGGR